MSESLKIAHNGQWTLEKSDTRVSDKEMDERAKKIKDKPLVPLKGFDSKGRMVGVKGVPDPKNPPSDSPIDTDRYETHGSSAKHVLNKASPPPAPKAPAKFSRNNISHIIHHDEGGINSKWDVHLKDGSVHQAHSVDSESPKWSHDDSHVEAKHNSLAHALTHARDQSSVHSKEDETNVTHHGPGGNLIRHIRTEK